jgi:hypothetical protein
MGLLFVLLVIFRTGSGTYLSRAEIKKGAKYPSFSRFDFTPLNYKKINQSSTEASSFFSLYNSTPAL